ncbi:calponin-3-like isoform X1 [Acipenser ruthenus]|uniref:calponin-3-like isoform X1 n=1 Tax=Acipenser ruthenus TaxID=7906 RepID=UPI00274067CB|nr:calponin-3-like isoform X1 [Acipenser ruthenus]
MGVILGAIVGLLITLLICTVRLFLVLQKNVDYIPGKKGAVSVLVVAGSGGHTTEILRLMASLSRSYSPRHYVIADTDKMSEDKIRTLENSHKEKDTTRQFTIQRIPRSREVQQSWSSSVLTTLYSLLYSVPLVFKLKPDLIAQKYDYQKEEELRVWIEDVTGMQIGGENFQKGLKDGVILCKLINKLQPGSVKKINHSQLNWHMLENLGNFIKAILAYGMKPNDIFEANDLFESGNMTQVQTSLLALASMAKTKGINPKIDIGVKYADKQERCFDEEKMKAGQCVIGLQMGTNKCASQAGMTAYGTRRHLYDPKTQTDKPYDQTTISLQMGTNKGASQAGMVSPGTRRDIFDQKVAMQPVDSSTISLQMGTNKVASQKGMSVYGLGRQVYDSKYCTAPTEPVMHTNGSQGTGTNGSEISDSDYQAEYPEEYEGNYNDEYHGQYNDQGVDY